ncbi:AI-2 transport protein TqsA [Tsuneonella dongtanensis]|uniref:AI-2 transport protein TqsA n=1 Tax=Tsuneonella dongtanensis TaxID=692370 RepID=A0A1B2AC53_9SPHN|nr:AI-2E family transporter [Tsuneonella dongtanensis]ANY19717.1 AI-2 transport protein TqsA [Tsuneonella dongtanensis]
MSEARPTTDLDAPAVPRRTSRTARMTFAAQELRLISALVVILGLGLFLALPFVLSVGSVVFLPLVTALILTIVLSPLADKLASWGLPNVLASLLSLLVMLSVLVLAAVLILQPAITLFDSLPAILDQLGERFKDLQRQFYWLGEANRQIAEITGETAPEVVVATPSMIEEFAYATPTVVLETLLTFLMAFFMVEARVRMRRRLLLERSDFGASLKAARVIREVQDRVAAYILTVTMINAGVGVVVALGAWALGLDAPVMWGGLAAILNFLPYIGPLTMVAVLALFGVGTADTVFLGIIPAAAYLALHTIESNAVTPAVLGKRFTMNPVLILIALSYFTWIWGVLGALLSVPILLTLTAFFDHVGRPNLVGFLFGEPLFGEPPVAEAAEGVPDGPLPAPHERERTV